MDSGNQRLSFGHEENERMQKELKVAKYNISIKMQQTGNLHSFFGREEIERMQKELMIAKNNISIKMQQTGLAHELLDADTHVSKIKKELAESKENSYTKTEYARPSLRPALKEVDIQKFCNRMGAPYCTAKFEHTYHEKEMKNEINYAVASQVLPNFIPDDVTTPDSFRNIPSDHVFNTKEEKNQKNYAFQSGVHPGFIQGGFPYPCGSLTPLTVNSTFQGTENQQNDAGESSLRSESFHRGVLIAKTGSNLIPGITMPLREEECNVFKNLKAVNRSVRYQDYEVDSHQRMQTLFNQRTLIPFDFVKDKEPDFEWNKEHRQWNWQAYSEGIPQHEKSIPDRPPACVICLSNPSKNILFCADCINSIEG